MAAVRADGPRGKVGAGEPRHNGGPGALRPRAALPTIPRRGRRGQPELRADAPGWNPTLSLLVPAWFAAGAAWWTLLEYLLHRFAFHGGVAVLGKGHLAHHADPRDRRLIVASPAGVALGLALHGFVFLGLLGPVRGGGALAGVLVGYAAYEAVHLAVHRPRPRSRLLRRLRRHHLLHHGAEPDARFGVTSAFWDRVFGTLPRAPRVPGLTRRQARVTRAVAEALFADEAGAPPRGRIDVAVREVGLFARRAGTQTRLALRVALVVVQASPLLLCGKLRRFTAASLPLRAACFERLERGRLGILAVVLKLSLCLAYFEGEALAETGYDGPGLPRTARSVPIAPARVASAPAGEERE